TALHWAAYHQNVAAAKALLTRGAKPSAVTGTGMTPLALACEAGNADLVKLLLKARVRARDRARSLRNRGSCHCQGCQHGPYAGGKALHTTHHVLSSDVAPGGSVWWISGWRVQAPWTFDHSTNRLPRATGVPPMESNTYTLPRSMDV
ncbi:MAG: ankyrin repeat domain-containing protein, partial [Gammaproteobacteria bacterium]